MCYLFALFISKTNLHRMKHNMECVVTNNKYVVTNVIITIYIYIIFVSIKNYRNEEKSYYIIY